MTARQPVCLELAAVQGIFSGYRVRKFAVLFCHRLREQGKRPGYRGLTALHDAVLQGLPHGEDVPAQGVCGLACVDDRENRFAIHKLEAARGQRHELGQKEAYSQMGVMDVMDVDSKKVSQQMLNLAEVRYRPLLVFFVFYEACQRKAEAH